MAWAKQGHNILWQKSFPRQNGEKVENLFTKKFAGKRKKCLTERHTVRSHGRPFTGVHLRVDQLEKHHQKRCEVLLDACATPKTACEILPVLFEREIVDTHQCMFAMGESIAHMNYLAAQKKLVRIDGDPVRFIRS